MPEGDSIFRLARRLGRVLTGKVIESAESWVPAVDAEALVGRVMLSVESRGKSLLIHLDDGRMVHSHMRMTGSWSVHPRAERWRKPRSAARLAIRTTEAEAVCFDAPVVELLTPWKAKHHPYLASLGPDLLGDVTFAGAGPSAASSSPSTSPFDADRARAGLRACAGKTIAEALLVQSAVAGIGNVYKSEVLFIERVDPFVDVASLDDAVLDRLIARARTLLRRNVGRGPRKTRFADGPNVWVYERSGDPCLVCGERVRMRRVGASGRSTYFCASCQRVGATG